MWNTSADGPTQLMGLICTWLSLGGCQTSPLNQHTWYLDSISQIMANESTGNCVPVERPKKDMPPPPPPSSADSLLCERPLQISIAVDVFFLFFLRIHSVDIWQAADIIFSKMKVKRENSILLLSFFLCSIYPWAYEEGEVYLASLLICSS